MIDVLDELGIADDTIVVWVRDVRAALEEAARDVVTVEIGDEIAAQLEEG